MTSDGEAAGVSTGRLRIVRILMGVAALGALAAAAGAASAVGEAGAATIMVETWRLYGFLVFAGLFALLGWRPLGYRWLWEIVILNKLLLTGTAAGYVTGVIGPGDVDGADAALVADGILTVILVVAYVLCQGWRAGPHPRQDGTAPVASTGPAGSP